MAAMSRVNGFAFSDVEPAIRHPMVGHAESDHLLTFPKFDTIGKEAVITKVGHILANFARLHIDFYFKICIFRFRIFVFVPSSASDLLLLQGQAVCLGECNPDRIFQ
jgi:hypothetical protein